MAVSQVLLVLGRVGLVVAAAGERLRGSAEPSITAAYDWVLRGEGPAGSG